MTAVTLTIGGRRHEGWTSATVVRALETIAGSFRISLSERSPGETTPRVIRHGDACEVALDGDRVIRGHVDTVRPSYDAQSHTIEVGGRDATGDLVDCSAPTKPGEWHGATLGEIAAALTEPFGIPVRAEVDTGEPFRRFRIEEGETVFEAIERACRFRAILPQSDGNGGLILGRPTRSRSATRLERGVNILSTSAEFSLIDRYSDYLLLGQQPGSDDFFGEDAAHVVASAKDEGVARHRPLTLIAEQALDKVEAQARVDWEASFRAARARRATVSVQGWRERPNGELWAPGRLVPVSCDWLGLDAELLVASVEQSIGEEGTITRLTLMPEGAFVPRLTAEPEPEATGWWG